MHNHLYYSAVVMTRNQHNKSTKPRRGRPTKVAKQTLPTPRVSSRANKGTHSARPNNNPHPMPQDDNVSVRSDAGRHSQHGYDTDSDDDMGAHQGPSLPAPSDWEARLDAQDARVDAQDARVDAQDARVDARFDRLEALIANALSSPQPRVPSQPSLAQPQHTHASTSQAMAPPNKNPGTQSLSAHSSDSTHTNAVDSDMDSVVPVPAVRHSFGLLVGEHISQTLRQKIVTDKYVDMHDLLPENTKAEQHLVLTSSLAGDNLKLLKDSKDVKISILQWNQAFVHYMAIYYTTVAPNLQGNLFLEMLTYQRDINTLATQDLPWWRYDSQFRRDRSVNPSRFSFATLRHDLIASLTVSRRNNQPFRDSFRQNKFSSNDRRFNRRTRPASQTDGRQACPTGFCFKYHATNEKCQTQNCKYKHECFKCNHKHPIFMCKQ